MATASMKERFGIVRQHARMLSALGVGLDRGARVLDFGCGSGSHVYDYRDEGFDAYGFDVTPSVQYRQPGDEKFFGLAAGGGDYRIPFETGSFDFVFSCEVFEHVRNPEAAFAEIARVLKRGGTAIHTSPARYRFFEPHTGVPLGGAIQRYGWYLLWALLGVRNEFQKGMGPFARARTNLEFMKTSVNYQGTGQILGTALSHFREAELVPHLWWLGNAGYSLQGALCLLVPLYRALYAKFGMVVLFTRK